MTMPHVSAAGWRVAYTDLLTGLYLGTPVVYPWAANHYPFHLPPPGRVGFTLSNEPDAGISAPAPVMVSLINHLWPAGSGGGSAPASLSNSYNGEIDVWGPAKMMMMPCWVPVVGWPMDSITLAITPLASSAWGVADGSISIRVALVVESDHRGSYPISGWDS